MQVDKDPFPEAVITNMAAAEWLADQLMVANQKTRAEKLAIAEQMVEELSEVDSETLGNEPDEIDIMWDLKDIPEVKLVVADTPVNEGTNGGPESSE